MSDKNDLKITKWVFYCSNTFLLFGAFVNLINEKYFAFCIESIMVSFILYFGSKILANRTARLKEFEDNVKKIEDYEKQLGIKS